MKRRHFVYTGIGVGTTMIAGCTGDDTQIPGDDTVHNDADDTDDSDDARTTDDEESDRGTFRLLISDQPTAIDDFDELNVSFASARVFRGDGEGLEQDDEVIDDDDGDVPADADDEVENGGDDTDDQVDDEASDTNDEDESSEGRGYVEFDLDGATVDLTQVIGDRAIAVLQDELEAGQYATIELRAQDVEGIVDGNQVEVFIPSGRLRIVRPFEVVAGEEISFVFDINVVKRGQQDRYNLLPVIGKSGVVGRDVEVEEIDPDEEESAADEDPKEADDEADDAPSDQSQEQGA